MGRKRQVRKPVLLFGEGPTEGLLLGLIKQHYSTELSDKKVTVGHATGGSSGSILLELKKKYLDTGVPSTPALVLLDEDKGLDEDAEGILVGYPNIHVVFSRPQRLEGFLLELLGDLPPISQQHSDRLKKRFQDHHLGSRSGVLKLFKQKRASLLPRELFETRKASNAPLKEIFTFLEIL